MYMQRCCDNTSEQLFHCNLSPRCTSIQMQHVGPTWSLYQKFRCRALSRSIYIFKNFFNERSLYRESTRFPICLSSFSRLFVWSVFLPVSPLQLKGRNTSMCQVYKSHRRDLILRYRPFQRASSANETKAVHVSRLGGVSRRPYTSICLAP